MAEVYLVRHGKTELNDDKHVSQDRIRGWKDVPLSDEGRKEADTIGKELRNKGIQHIYSSDLSRAKETADIVSKYLKLPVKVTKEFRPWDLGEFTGQSTEKSMPKIHDYVDNKPDKPIPKGESFNSFADRFHGGLDKVLRDHDNHTVAIVTHHRGERLIKASIQADGTIQPDKTNFNIFKEKGEPPGHFEKITLNYGKKGGSLRNTISDSVREAKLSGGKEVKNG